MISVLVKRGKFGHMEAYTEGRRLCEENGTKQPQVKERQGLLANTTSYEKNKE